MQDLTSAAAYYHQSMMMTKQKQPELPEQEQLKCPRCDSPNTKFCYYNNYNLSQPRHFCKNCRRYWTKGGVLRNIPIGGGSRKNNKRSGSSSSTNFKNNKTITVSNQKFDDHGSSREKLKEEEEEEEERVSTGVSGQEMDPTLMLYGLPVVDQIGGSFSSLLASNMQMGGGIYESGSRWYPGMDLGLGSGLQKNDDTWTDLTMNRVEKH